MRSTQIPVSMAIVAALLAGACASVDAQWIACEKSASTFEQLADCATDVLQADATERTRERAEGRARRFSLAANQLGVRMRTGELGEAQARVELHRALDGFLDEARDERLVPVRQLPRSMTCSPTGAGVVCSGN